MEQINKQNIPLFWNGYCPESWLQGKTVRMKLNDMDFYESEETGLQIYVLRGVQAIILNFRGKGKFRSTNTFGGEIEYGEYLSPQTTDTPPFNNGVVFKDSEEIGRYLTSILKKEV